MQTRASLANTWVHELTGQSCVHAAALAALPRHATSVPCAAAANMASQTSCWVVVVVVVWCTAAMQSSPTAMRSGRNWRSTPHHCCVYPPLLQHLSTHTGLLASGGAPPRTAPHAWEWAAHSSLQQCTSNTAHSSGHTLGSNMTKSHATTSSSSSSSSRDVATDSHNTHTWRHSMQQPLLRRECNRVARVPQQWAGATAQ